MRRRADDRAEREVERLQKRNKRLEDENARLKRDLDAARRAGCRQAAPFAKPRIRDPKKPGRRPGAAYGRPARRLGEDAAGLSPTNISRLTAPGRRIAGRSGAGTCRTATTSTCGWTASASTSAWRTTVCARW